VRSFVSQYHAQTTAAVDEAFREPAASCGESAQDFIKSTAKPVNSVPGVERAVKTSDKRDIDNHLATDCTNLDRHCTALAFP
jgi:hypothetical protein